MDKIIYGLRENKIVFYIGQTFNIQKRLTSHLHLSKKLVTDKDKKIQSALLNGRDIDIKKISECNPEVSNQLEKETIETYFNKGYKLLNYNHCICKNVFSKKDLKVLQLMADDHTATSISKITGISIRTIENIRNGMKKKAKVKGIPGLLIYAYNKKLIV